MPESTPGRAPGGAGNKAKGAYQDRDKPAQIRFSNIAAGKGAAARGKAGAGPAWAAIEAGGDGSRGARHRPGRAPGLRAGIPWIWWLGAARDGPACVGDAILGTDKSPGRAACCVPFLCDSPDLKWLQSNYQILIV